MSLSRNRWYKDSSEPWTDHAPALWSVVVLRWLLDIHKGADRKGVKQSEGQFAYASDRLYNGESVVLGRRGVIDTHLHIAHVVVILRMRRSAFMSAAVIGQIDIRQALTC